MKYCRMNEFFITEILSVINFLELVFFFFKKKSEHKLHFRINFTNKISEISLS